MTFRLSAFEDDDAAFDVCAIGNAIVDIIAESDEAFLRDHGVPKGGMLLVDEARADYLYSRVGPGLETSSGGSAANTTAGIASLGGKPAYIGKIRDDQFGGVFRHDLRSLGVHFATSPLSEGPSTARCLVLVTADSQRSMCTYLGACVELQERDVEESIVRQSRVLYLEGYLFDKPEPQAAFRHAARLAHQAGRLVALTLSDPFCVERHRDAFRALVKKDVDILFANEHELVALYQTNTFEEAMAMADTECKVAVGTRSASGALIAHNSELVKIEAEPVARVIDSTGAGDAFAAGFLYGLTHGHRLSSCGRLGAIVAAEVIGHYGPRPECDLKTLALQKGLDLWGKDG